MIKNTNNFQLNINMNFPYTSFSDPVSSPSNHLLKNQIFTSDFILDSTVFAKKWIILIYNSSYGNFLEAGNSQNPLSWIWTTSQVANTRFTLPIKVWRGRFCGNNTTSPECCPGFRRDSSYQRLASPKIASRPPQKAPWQ